MKPYTVTEFNSLIRDTLLDGIGEVAVQGEIVDFRDRQSQLVFFEIKDTQSRLLCFLLRYELKAPLSDGQEVIVRGIPSLFKKNSGFHLRVSSIELIGEGALRRQFEALKAKLASEGLFAAERKRSLHPYPEHIALLTSPDAAAYRDVLRILRDRWPVARVELFRTAVQGHEAIPSILRAFERLRARASVFDHAILTRGGGSLEDLQAFNSEQVARAVYACPVPVVCGIGHERNDTIADFVADVRGATPSHAAQLSVPNLPDVLFALEAVEDDLGRGLRTLLAEGEARAGRAARVFASALARERERFSLNRERYRGGWRALARSHAEALYAWRALRTRLPAAAKTWRQHLRQRLQAAAQLFSAVSPEATLRRGYTLTYRGKRLVRSLKDLAVGDTLRTIFRDGAAASTVTEKYRHP